MRAGEQLSDWSDMLLLLSATPLNLGTDDLFNLLQLLDAGEFFDKHTLQVQLQPNAVLTGIHRGVSDPRTDSAGLAAQLHSIRRMAYGAASAARREFSELDRLLQGGERTVADGAQIRRLCLELNTLSQVLTRTRRVEVEEQRALREPIDVGVALTETEQALYDAVVGWQTELGGRQSCRAGPSVDTGRQPAQPAEALPKHQFAGHIAGSTPAQRAGRHPHRHLILHYQMF